MLFRSSQRRSDPVSARSDPASARSKFCRKFGRTCFVPQPTQSVLHLQNSHKTGNSSYPDSQLTFQIQHRSQNKVQKHFKIIFLKTETSTASTIYTKRRHRQPQKHVRTSLNPKNEARRPKHQKFKCLILKCAVNREKLISTPSLRGRRRRLSIRARS